MRHSIFPLSLLALALLCTGCDKENATLGSTSTQPQISQSQSSQVQFGAPNQSEKIDSSNSTIDKMNSELDEWYSKELEKDERETASASYDDFPIFNPYDYDNYTPPEYNDPFSDYDPLEGFESDNHYADIPEPSVPSYDGNDPFSEQKN